MRFKSPLWYPIAIGLSAINVVAVGVAAGSAEPWHAGVHAVLGLGFGLWAQRLRLRSSTGGSDRALDREERLEALEADMTQLRRELIEAQERLDFAERLLTQQSEPRRISPEP